jgi:aryl-alcohol dehydrogenase
VIGWPYCGICKHCRAGEPRYCVRLAELLTGGGRSDGRSALRRLDGSRVASHFYGQSSFATHAIATERNAVKLADDADLTIAGPLGCGIQTGAGTVLNRLQPESGQSIAVFGVGAVGLTAVMAAAVAGCDPIIAVDVKPNRLALAKELGATHIVDATTVDDVVGTIQQITRVGVNFSIDTTAIEAVAEQAVSALTFLGTAAVLGLGPAGTNLKVDMTQLVLPGRTVTGVVEGDSDPDTFIPRLALLQAEGKFPYDRLITTYAFDDINRAIADAESGVVTKAVLVVEHARTRPREPTEQRGR